MAGWSDGRDDLKELNKESKIEGKGRIYKGYSKNEKIRMVTTSRPTYTTNT